MSDTVVATPAASAAPARFAAAGPEHCIEQRPDGVYADPAVLGTTVLAAVDAILQSGSYLAGLDYPLLIKAIYGCGPALPAGPDGQPVVRLARAILPFDAQRRSLYRSVRIAGGQAEYCFEPVYLPAADGEGELPASLDADEFVADMWLKGIRFGIDMAAVRAGIANPGAGRSVVARRQEPVPGVDAMVVEVSDDIHRSDAPRQLANGKLDLMRFQNRFPQVQRGTCLLQKLPPRAGEPGFELSGIRIEPAAPRELDFSLFAGEGTCVERASAGEYLVATRTGYLDVDRASGRIAVGDKIVSRDGVSAKTTGNLELTGDYEEFGEVQEKRVIEGNGITVHADVYGEIVSRGGMVRLRANLVGGSAHNKCGDIQVDGVTANAVVQALDGGVILARAENCVIQGKRVRIAQAINCEIAAEDVSIGQAEGCAVAGRRIRIDSTSAWHASDMLVYVLCADCSRIDAARDEIKGRLVQIEAAMARHQNELGQLCAQPALRKYLDIAGRVRSGEAVLNPAQAQQFRQMGQAVSPELQRIGEVSAARKALAEDMAGGQALLARLAVQRSERAATSTLALGQLAGDTQVRLLAFDPDAPALHHLPPRELKGRLRANEGTPLYAGACGSYGWESGAGMPAPD
ncbi:flagellar assembly protein A [Massilia sp. GCM10023247]|uniref:flagellar assembly protein A n=1 Tax=Massilia sp. GCM10023247 TaxID=3252643 RepID=UPI0036085671